MMESLKLNGYIYKNYQAITGNAIDPAEVKRMGGNYYHRVHFQGLSKE
jgi:hypothetical protein